MEHVLHRMREKEVLEYKNCRSEAIRHPASKRFSLIRWKGADEYTIHVTLSFGDHKKLLEQRSSNLWHAVCAHSPLVSVLHQQAFGR